MTKIVYNQDNGIAAVIIPCGAGCVINPDTEEFFTMEEIAKKDVPTGKKYKIVDVSGISSDRSFRDAWTVDESDLTDGVGE